MIRADGRRAPQRLPGHAVEGPHRAGPVVDVGALDHVEGAVVVEVRQGRARGGDAVEARRPAQVATAVDRLDGIGVRGPGEVAAGPEDRPGGPAGQEAADGRGGVDGLVGVVVTDQPPAGVEDPQVAPVGVVLAAPETRRLVSALDDLGLAGSVEVAQRRGRKDAVGGEEGPAGEGGARAGVEGVLLLVERAGHHVGGARAQGPHAEGGLDPLSGLEVGRRVDHRGEPLQVGRGAEGLVAPLGRVGGVARADEDRVGPATDVGDRGGRVDGHPGGGRPPGHGAPVDDVEAVDEPVAVAHDHRRAVTVEDGHVGRRLGHRPAPVVEDVVPHRGVGPGRVGRRGRGGPDHPEGAQRHQHGGQGGEHDGRPSDAAGPAGHGDGVRADLGDEGAAGQAPMMARPTLSSPTCPRSAGSGAGRPSSRRTAPCRTRRSPRRRRRSGSRYRRRRPASPRSGG